MVVIYIGIDPGNTTGCFRVDGEHPRNWEAVQLDDPVAVLDWVRTIIEDGPTEVAIERFNISQRTIMTKRELVALDVIGAVKVLCAASNVYCIMQNASEAKRFTNHYLRGIGWYSPNQPHANDAARHAFLLVLHRCPGILNELVDSVE